MADTTERIILDVDERGVATALSSANKHVAAMERTVYSTGRSVEQNLLVKIANLKQTMQGDPLQLQRLDQLQERVLGRMKNNVQVFGDKIRQFIASPLQSVSEAAGTVAGKLGMVGTALAVGVGVFAGTAKAGFDAAKSLGEYGVRIKDIAIRTGLTNKEVAQFSFAMKRAGGDIASVEGIMRKLSQGLADNGEEGKAAREGLAQLGIKARDSQGALRPMSSILLQVSESLNAIEGTANRNALAIKILGRSALEALPALLELADGVRRAKELGLGPSEEDLRRFKEYQQVITEAEALWERFARGVKRPLAALFTVVMKAVTPDGKPIPFETLYSVTQLRTHGTVGEPQGPASATYGTRKALSLQSEIDKWNTTLMISDDTRQYAQTKSGLEEALKGSRSKAELARQEYFGFSGPSERAKELRSKWVSLEADAKRYEDRLKSLQEQLEQVKKLSTFQLDEEKMIPGPQRRMVPSLYGERGFGDAWTTERYMPEETIAKANAEYVAALADMNRARAEGEAQLFHQRNARAEAERRAELAHRIKVAELTAGPGSELSAVEQIYRLRIEGARTEEEMQAARYDREEQILELQKRRFDEIRSSFESLFDTMLSGSRGVWDAMKRTFFSIFLTPVKQQLATLTASLFTGRGYGGGGMAPAAGGWSGALAGVGGMFGGGGGTFGSGWGGSGNPYVFSAAGGGGSSQSAMSAQDLYMAINGQGSLGGGSGSAMKHNILQQIMSGKWSGFGNSKYGSAASGLGTMLGMGLALNGMQSGSGAKTIGGTSLAAFSTFGKQIGVVGSLGAGMFVDAMRRGGKTGIWEGAAGGAMLGFTVGGPIGAVIGAAVGFTAGLIRSFFKSATEKLREKIKTVYGVDVTEKNILQQILEIIKQNYGGNLDMGVRSSTVRELVELYALSTGKNFTAKASMQAYTYSQSGGAYTQQPLGGGYSMGSGASLDSLRGTSQTSGGGGTTVLNFQIDGKTVATATLQNNRVVTAANIKSMRSNAGRRELTALQLSPNLIT